MKQWRRHRLLCKSSKICPVANHCMAGCNIFHIHIRRRWEDNSEWEWCSALHELLQWSMWHWVSGLEFVRVPVSANALPVFGWCQKTECVGTCAPFIALLNIYVSNNRLDFVGIFHSSLKYETIRAMSDTPVDVLLVHTNIIHFSQIANALYSLMCVPSVCVCLCLCSMIES